MIVSQGSRQALPIVIGVTLLTFSATQVAKASTTPTGLTSSNYTRASATLSPAGYAGIRIGSEPEGFHGYTLTNRRRRRDECYVTDVEEAPGLALLVTSGTIKRISIGEHGTSPIKTDRGIGIGSTEASVRQAYNPLRYTPHKYVASPAAYLTWLDTSHKRGVRFETGTDRRVKIIHVGLMPELDYVERCG